METWYRVSLAPKDIAAGKHIALRDTFQILFMANHGPKDAAMFTTAESRSPSDYFFSPGAVRFSKALIDGFSGIECPALKAAGLSLLAGNQQLDAIPFSK